MSRLLLLGALGLGCVSSGAHEEVLQERDSLSRDRRQLTQQVEALQTENESLASERVALIGENEDLRDERDALRGEASRLTDANEELSENLDVTTAEMLEKRAEVNRLRDTYRGLLADLESEVAAGQIEIEQLREGVRVNVSDDILFASGSARLDRIGAEVLAKVAQNLRKGDFRIEVQGHTDNIAIRGSLAKRYPTNWELASARASRVVRLFQEAGVQGERMNAVSYAEFAPVAPNDTEENRWLNRRIEIRLLPAEAPVEVVLPDSEASSPPEP